MQKDKKKAVLELLSKIPKGKVVTYKQISDFLDINSPQFVGKILGNNPDPSKYPCHRVVYRDGKLSPKYSFGGEKAQKKKLEEEGVRFSGDRVDLKRSLYLFVGTPR
ncbi:cysteine methyltransferase [Candidatus Dojkabacteria bacterium]|nr:cysteine methyltransferase [Candidatus Dojkabacteria bacterium]